MVRHLYVHIPFCHRVCPYCSFFKHTPGGTDVGGFVKAILREAELRAQLTPLQLETVYFGGGTPTALSETHLETLLTGLQQRLDFSKVTEFTMEANPRTVPAKKAELMHRMGVDRISLGVQAWDSATLQTLGRDHSPEEAEATYHQLKQTGFRSINIDLMFSIPGQALATWEATLERTLALKPDHLSAYNLNYEEDTEFFDRLHRGQYQQAPDEDASCFDLARKRLGAAGYEHYEISNYALPGHQSRHNAAYWFGADYLALGPGATSTVDARRWQNVRNTPTYIAALNADTLPETEIERLTSEQRRTERFGLELRTRRGLSAHQIRPAQQRLLTQFANDGLLFIDGPYVKLTHLGQPLVDSLAVALMG